MSDLEKTFLLKRLPEYLEATPGHIIYGAQRTVVCGTLELPWKDNHQDISCIPRGEYHIAITYSSKFKRKLIEVLNVLGRSGVRLHPANQITELEGCIAPCSFLVIEAHRLWARQSTDAYNFLERIIKEDGITKLIIE